MHTDEKMAYLYGLVLMVFLAFAVGSLMGPSNVALLILFGLGLLTTVIGSKLIHRAMVIGIKKEREYASSNSG